MSPICFQEGKHRQRLRAPMARIGMTLIHKQAEKRASVLDTRNRPNGTSIIGRRSLSFPSHGL